MAVRTLTSTYLRYSNGVDSVEIFKIRRSLCLKFFIPSDNGENVFFRV
jgi:hypothetical protein